MDLEDLEAASLPAITTVTTTYPAFLRAPGFSLSPIWKLFADVGGKITRRNVIDALKYVLWGGLGEIGRRLMRWGLERFNLQYSTTATFTAGDPTYEWILLFLTENDIWKSTRDFQVTAKTGSRQGGVVPAVRVRYPWDAPVDAKSNDHRKIQAEFVPGYGKPHLFRWNGYWMEIKKDIKKGSNANVAYNGVAQQLSTLSLTIYTLDINVLTTFIDSARNRYMEANEPRVIIHTTSAYNHYGPGGAWSAAKSKSRRHLNSLILEDHAIDKILVDMREFLDSEQWYKDAGIPHRRGYLLHGPPGTGKSSTIHVLAGELGLEVYCISMASSGMDDSMLETLISSVPAYNILLIEDIDCAFATREDDDDDDKDDPNAIFKPIGTKPKMTLSGLLNAIDGVGTDDGKVFFATTNYPDKLDSAILRPGRVDVKIEYRLASKDQSRRLFCQFFPVAKLHTYQHSDSEKALDIDALAGEFAENLPEREFSTAELQGYLLNYKHDPIGATRGFEKWIADEREERRLREEREALRKAQREAKKAAAKEKAKQLQEQHAMMNGYGGLNVNGMNGKASASKAGSSVGEDSEPERAE